MVSDIQLLVFSVLLASGCGVVPAYISDKFSPFQRGDAKWIFIGPVMYVYTLLISTVSAAILYAALSILSVSSPAFYAASIIGVVGLIAFLFLSGWFASLAYRNRKEFEEAKSQASANK